MSRGPMGRYFFVLHEARNWLVQAGVRDRPGESGALLLANIENVLHAPQDAPLIRRGVSGLIELLIPHLCECGCDKKTATYQKSTERSGRRRGYPLRFCHGHQNRMKRRGYTVDAQTGCWNYNGRLRSGGYADAIWNGKRNVPGHRYYYELAKGPIPPGLHLDHLCRNHPCVNPDHLEPVTAAENVRRGKLPKLSMQKAREIRALSGIISVKHLAARFGVAPATVRDVINGKQWREETDHAA